ncbi:MAG: secretin N-terminal domain-containing protein [Kiritimatiellales bacterium]
MDVNLKNVEWKPALQSILDSNNLELYEKTPGSAVYSVRKKLADAPQAMNVKTFKLDYASVSNVNEMIRSMVPERGKISVFPARNTIVVQSTPENLMDIQAMIAAIDLPRQQVFIEAKFMELSDSASEKIGIDWQVLGGYGVGVNGIGGSYDFADSKKDGINNTSGSAMNQFTDIAGRPYENLEKQPDTTVINPAGGFLNNIDYAARPGSIGPNDSRTFGVTPTGIASNLFQTTSFDESTVKRTLGATLNASDFKLVLAALKEINGTKIVSNPKVIVANEEMASIHIGNKKPNVRGQTQTAGDSQTSRTYGLDEKEPYFEDGVKVEVTPTINTASNITVKIQPTLDQLDVVPFEAPDGTQFYGKTTKTINTIFSLASGQTAAIGGLTRTSSSDIERKVPLLGSLPLIGRLFSYSAKEKGQAETIIFVTVGLANPEHINMETGLPQESSLAMRYDAKSRAEHQIKDVERKLVEQQETERAQETIKKLDDAEQKRLEKKNK